MRWIPRPVRRAAMYLTLPILTVVSIVVLLGLSILYLVQKLRGAKPERYGPRAASADS